jgi:hypothetical protein
MEMSHDGILKFMQDYFAAYGESGQDRALADRMTEYFSPDFVFTGYLGLPEPVVYRGRDTFLARGASHPSSYERLTPEEMTIDETQQRVSAVIKFEFIDRQTGDVLAVERGATHYQLAFGENGGIRIKSFIFLPQRVAPGILTGFDVFQRDSRSSDSPKRHTQAD